jgi:hypothetical protein
MYSQGSKADPWDAQNMFIPTMIFQVQGLALET